MFFDQSGHPSVNVLGQGRASAGAQVGSAGHELDCARKRPARPVDDEHQAVEPLGAQAYEPHVRAHLIAHVHLGEIPDVMFEIEEAHLVDLEPALIDAQHVE